MDDAVLNCVLLVCCGDAQAQDALAKFFEKYGGMDEENARKASACTLEHFDLAEKGTLQAFKDSVARLARGENYKADKKADDQSEG